LLVLSIVVILWFAVAMNFYSFNFNF
jgi:hypothetical protein